MLISAIKHGVNSGLAVAGGFAVLAGGALAWWSYRRPTSGTPVLLPLALNLLVGGLVLLIQSLVSSDPGRLLPYAIGAVAATVSIGVAMGVRHRLMGAEIADGTRPELGGLRLYSRSSSAFSKTVGSEFGAYARQFIESGQTRFRILGIDWTELFGEGVSATSERYETILATRGSSIRVVLLDPRSIEGYEKRLSEFELIHEGQKRYLPNHPGRVYGKILGTVRMMADYHKRFPERFQYRFVDSIPDFCMVMDDTRVLFHPYIRSHKGWDSPIFLADRVPGGIYEVLEEYFEFLWATPKRMIKPGEEASYLDQVAGLTTEFEALVRDACSGHDGCDSIL